MADIVRYHNHMNTISFGKFNEKELDLFFSICFKLKEEETKKIVLNFSELRELSSYENRNLHRFIKTLDSTYNKMLNLNMRVFEDEKNYTRFNLFSEYTISENNKTVTIAINERFRYILNELTGNYTKFELMEFVNLKSSYSKNVFKLLKQWHSIGFFEIDIEEFKRLLDIPEKYRMSEIDKRVLTPISGELSQHFINLNIEKIKLGKTVSKLKFTWAKGITVITEKEDAPKGKKKIAVSHGEQTTMFSEKKVAPKVSIEKSREQLLKELENYKNSEQNATTKKEETLVPVRDVKPREDKISKKVFDLEYEEFLEWKKMKKKHFKEKQEIDRDEKEKADIEFKITKGASRGGRFFTDKDIEEELLLDKNGNKLNGIALKMRVKKILGTMN